MKFITKLFLLALIVGFVACDSELDLQDNPNAVTPDNASVEDLYNSIQIDFAGLFDNVQATGGRLTRMYHMGNFNYEAHTEPATANGMWFSAYSSLFPDMDALLALTTERGLDVHTASVNILRAYTLMALVDNLNDIPFSEAGQGTDIVSPNRDGGAAVYAQAVTLLEESVALLASTNATGPTNDFYYGGSIANWSALANTLRIRAAVTTRLVDPSGAAATINSIVASGNFISSAGSDFQAQFSTERNNPNSRHPDYNNHYEVGDGDYIPNYYMWLMAEGTLNADGLPAADPRLRYYFYRQVDNSLTQDPTTYSCHFSTLPDDPDGRPAHFDLVDPRLPYCVATENGYLGRDHGNGEGIPPDGPTRTNYGLYPAGGQFDDESFINRTDSRRVPGEFGGRGAGIFPIMLSSFVDFMRAEAALTVGTGEDARALLESGMRASIAKVQTFESLDPSTFTDTRVVRGETFTVRQLFVPDAEDIDEYIGIILAGYDAADATGRLNVVMTEYYKALYGNGLESYNNFRRTGMPNNIAPTLEPAGGEFSTVLFYPAVHVNRNANANQRASRTERVFWDDGSADVF